MQHNASVTMAYDIFWDMKMLPIQISAPEKVELYNKIYQKCSYK